MHKCTACRVRHLSCDQKPVCSECAECNRPCVRGYNLRFRHLNCPSSTPTRADYGRYEFFFDSRQTWLDTNSEIKFVMEDDESSCASPREVQVPGDDTILAMSGGKSGDIPVTHRTGSEQPSLRIGDDQETVHNEETPNQAPLSKLEILANQSLVDASLSGDTLYSNSRISGPRSPSTPIVTAWPLKDLREGRLLQHFVTHLAPWVCGPLDSCDWDSQLTF